MKDTSYWKIEWPKGGRGVRICVHEHKSLDKILWLCNKFLLEFIELRRSNTVITGNNVHYVLIGMHRCRICFGIHWVSPPLCLSYHCMLRYTRGNKCLRGNAAWIKGALSCFIHLFSPASGVNSSLLDLVPLQYHWSNPHTQHVYPDLLILLIKTVFIILLY